MNPNMKIFWQFYFLALTIPVGLVAIGIVAPQLFGLADLADYFPVLFTTMQENGIEPRGAALWPMVQVALINPMFWTINIFAAAPSIAACCIAAWHFGLPGLKDLASRLQPWRNGVPWQQGARWWLTMMATLAALKTLEYGLHLAFGLQTDWAWGVNLLSLTFVSFYLQALLFDQGGLLEETGWRGFALPLIQPLFATPLRAAVILGLLWAAWHLPREATSSYAGMLDFISSQTAFFVVSVYLTIIISFFFNKVGGSTLIAVAVHGLSNDSVGLSGGDVEGSSYLMDLCHTIPYVVVGTLIIARYGSQLGLQQGKAQGLR